MGLWIKWYCQSSSTSLGRIRFSCQLKMQLMHVGFHFKRRNTRTTCRTFLLERQVVGLNICKFWCVIIIKNLTRILWGIGWDQGLVPLVNGTALSKFNSKSHATWFSLFSKRKYEISKFWLVSQQQWIKYHNFCDMKPIYSVDNYFLHQVQAPKIADLWKIYKSWNLLRQVILSNALMCQQHLIRLLAFIF